MFKVSLRIAVAIFMFLVLVPNVFSQSDTENSSQEITLLRMTCHQYGFLSV